ncbi:DNA polymerase zeta catalytic subunit isoform X2 [Silene latifolia]|uniref:DNA polymerase zeta catalytic subunit isoform X2 n=1 Tax=Silene latifolia TaxID=37657 RepID=UPI003D76E2B3
MEAEEESQAKHSNIFSVRIVSIDYYMSPPIPDFDISYSSIHGRAVKEVPVIRIYGSTPSAQKACVHLHRALPYLYVPYSEIPHQSNQGGIVVENTISLALENALKLKGHAGSKRQHVHGCKVVRARKFYGYHSTEELFIKIYLYHPHDVSRAASLLLAGAIFERSIQPYEAHIPFLLQFLVDYNLYGMGHMHLVKMKFRHPVPDDLLRRYLEHSTPENADEIAGSDSRPLVWNSSTIKDDWMWQYPTEPCTSSYHVSNMVKRQSISELEGDASIEDVLNQQLKLYTSLSQTHSDVRMVQSLIPIWEEEFERSGVHHADILADSGKPLPQDVLRTLSNGFEYQDKLRELFHKAASTILTLSDNVKPMISAQSLLEERRPGRIGSQESNELEIKPSDETNIMQSVISPHSASFSEKEMDEMNFQSGTSGRDPKRAEPEDIALLKWLASSQAAEDINSEDELHQVTILNPVVPAATIDKVLEKANTDYESESQQECQDILDSVLDVLHCDEGTRNSTSCNQDVAPQALLKSRIPQLDGSGDDQLPTPTANSSEEGMEGGTSKCHSVSGSSTSATKRRRNKMEWGALPFSEVRPLSVDIHSGSGMDDSGKCTILTEGDAGVPASLRSTAHGAPNLSGKSEENSCCHVVDSTKLHRCSIRDLMRKKRCFMAESSECDKSDVGGVSNKDKNVILPRKLDFHLEQSDDLNMQSNEGFISDREQITKQKDFCDNQESSICCQAEKKDASGSLKTGQENVSDFVTPQSKSSSFCLIASDLVAHNTGPKFSDDRDVIADGIPKRTAASCSSCLSSFQGKGKRLLEGEDAGKSADHHEMCALSCNQMNFQNPQSMACTTRQQFVKDGTVEHYPFRSQDLESTYGYLQNEGRSGYTCMAFHKKPPIANWTYDASEDLMLIPTRSEGSFVEEDSDNEGTQVHGKSSEHVLPFFADSREDLSEKMHDSADFLQNTTLGIPTQYRNDGSFAYLLTRAISPPSVGSVINWLTHKDKEKVLKNPLPEFSDTLGSFHQSPLKPISSQMDQGKDRNLNIREDPICDLLSNCKDRRSPMKVKEAAVFSQDISQISGPSGQSKPTPLSQIGFKDPASFGAGQQLTLLSLEVHADSKGDLRPDPQHDAINVIALAIQNDDSSSVDIHVLLRGEPKSCGRYVDGCCKFLVHSDEIELLNQFIKIVCSIDPDILMGWDVQGGSLGFLAERATCIGVSLISRISRTPLETKAVKRDQDSFNKGNTEDVSSDRLISDTSLNDTTVIEDEWGRTHASGVHVNGRIILNVWRLVRGEVKLNLYTLEAVVEAVLRRKVPSIHWKILNKWFSSGPGQARFRCIDYVVERAKLNHEIVNQLDLVNRTSELARVFGIDFFSVLSRGSQYRVESMLIRLAHTQNYVLISPGIQQVASQPAMECIPLVMEPESGFYSDPVIVLDFQSLYPSMIIAYNLCYSTCLGNVAPSKADMLGVSSYSQDLRVLKDLKLQTLVTPNGVMYVSSEVRKGVLPRLLDEILSTRIMVKQAIKKLSASQKILNRIFNARQLALKLIANVTYGYTAAGFSGRMPCAELADSIVQCGRKTLEHAISVVNSHDKWNARVIYGDTDSLFVLLKGRSRKEAFQIGSEIASTITAINPNPVTLKMEKVYQSCFLLTKKRYVGYSYESLDQPKPIFDAKGIETVRRDTCAAVAKTMEKSLRMFFEHRDISQVRDFLQRQWSRILTGRISVQDFVCAKEVRLGTYSSRTSSCLPPAAIVASKAMRVDPRAEPRYAERVPYVVVHGEPGARLVDMVVDPQELLAINSPYRLNDIYYITKQIIPALQRVFGVLGCDLYQWFQEMPRTVRDAPTKHYFNAANSLRARIDYYYSSRHCVLCGELARASSRLCENCLKNRSFTAAAMTGRTAKLERDIQHLVAICRHCGGGDWVVESGVKCTSLACAVYYERVKVQKELRAFSTIATEAGFYPKCMVEWF